MIQPTSQFSGYYRTDALSSQTSKKAADAATASVASDRLSSEQTESLRSALASTPEIRPDVVERGRKLALDPTYPPAVIIEDLAKLMLASRDQSENA